jgi:hypothetical protein
MLKPQHLKHNESIQHVPNALSTSAKAGEKNIMLINEMILKKLKNCKKMILVAINNIFLSNLCCSMLHHKKEELSLFLNSNQFMQLNTMDLLQVRQLKHLALQSVQVNH